MIKKYDKQILKFGLAIGCSFSWFIFRAISGVYGVLIGGVGSGIIVGFTTWIVLKKFHLLSVHHWKSQILLLIGWIISFMCGGLIIFYVNNHLNLFTNSNILWITGYILNCAITGLISKFTVTLVLSIQQPAYNQRYPLQITLSWVNSFVIGGLIGILTVFILTDLIIRRIAFGSGISLMVILSHGVGGFIYGITVGRFLTKSIIISHEEK